MPIRIHTPGIEGRLELVTQRNAVVGKAQIVRLLDVPLGLLMIWAGVKLSRGGGELGATLAASGVGTIAYNLNNYWRQQQATAELAA